MGKKKSLSDKQIEEMALRASIIKLYVKDIVDMSLGAVPVNCGLYRDIHAIERKAQTLYRSLEIEATRKGWSVDQLSKVFAKTGSSS